MTLTQQQILNQEDPKALKTSTCDKSLEDTCIKSSTCSRHLPKKFVRRYVHQNGSTDKILGDHKIKILNEANKNQNWSTSLPKSKLNIISFRRSNSNFEHKLNKIEARKIEIGPYQRARNFSPSKKSKLKPKMKNYIQSPELRTEKLAGFNNGSWEGESWSLSASSSSKRWGLGRRRRPVC